MCKWQGDSKWPYMDKEMFCALFVGEISCGDENGHKSGVWVHLGPPMPDGDEDSQSKKCYVCSLEKWETFGVERRGDM